MDCSICSNLDECLYWLVHILANKLKKGASYCTVCLDKDFLLPNLRLVYTAIFFGNIAEQCNFEARILPSATISRDRKIPIEIALLRNFTMILSR
jgi:hypothetical protein